MPEAKPSDRGTATTDGSPPSSFPSQGVESRRSVRTNGSNGGGSEGGRFDYHSELEFARAEIVYWRDMYKVMVRILAEQHDDPALAWLDEVTRYKATRLH